MLIGNIDTHNIKQIQQIGISQFLCATGEDTLMQALEKIEIKSIVAEFGDNPFIGTQLNEYICPDEIESIMAEFME